MAAFILDTRIIHGDRPKSDTYHRLDQLASIEDLDQAIEAQACSLLGDSFAMLFLSLLDGVPYWPFNLSLHTK